MLVWIGIAEPHQQHPPGTLLSSPRRLCYDPHHPRMDPRTIEPITLSPELAATHELKSSHYDDARTQLKCQWIDRKSDGKGDGRVLWYHPNGSIKQAGVAHDGVATGTWHTFSEAGVLTQREDAQPDGTFVITQFDEHGRPVREGIRRKGPDGFFRDDGWWKHYENGTLVYEQLYRMGEYGARRPPLAALREALEDRRVRHALEKLAQNNPDVLYTGVDALLAEEPPLKLELRTALELARVSWDWTLHRAIPYVTPFGPAALAELNAEAKDLLAMDHPQAGDAQRTVILIAKCSGATLDESLDPLFYEALRGSEHQGNNEKIVAMLTELLAAMPEERRARHALSEPARNTYAHGTVLWMYAGRAAPSERVLTAALAKIAAFRKGEFTYSAARKTAVENTLRAYGRAAVPAFVAWLAGDGKKCPQRELVVRALADAGAPEGAETLLAFADDTIDEARKAAREGLEKLGAAAVPALESAAKGKKAKLKALAEELLAQLKASSAAGDTSGAGGAAATADATMPESVRALTELRAQLTEKERAEYRALVSDDYNETNSKVRVALAQDPVKTLVALSEFALENARKQTGTVRFDDFSWQTKHHLAKHAALPALLAELLVALPERGNWNARYAIRDKLDASTTAALEPLGWYFERKVPDTAKHFAAHLSELNAYGARRLLVACARDESKAVRTEAVGGLVRAGAKVIPDVLPLLARSDDGAVSAAEVLRALPDAQAIGALEAAIAREKNKKRREALEEALAACKTAGGGTAGGAIDTRTLDADLARRAAKSKKKVPAITLPTVRWSDGTELSEGALKWLMGALVDEQGAEPNAELVAVRRQLHDGDARSLFKAIDDAVGYTSESKWKVYAAGILGDAKQIEALGRPLQSWASSGSHALAGHAIEALRRNGTGPAIAWIDHWAEEASGKLLREAKAALARLCEERGLDRDGLVDLTTPRAADDEDAAIAAIRKRLEGAMIVGRTFGADHLRGFVWENPLVARAAEGSVWKGADGTLGVLIGNGFVDAKGEGVELSAPVTLPHPCDLTDAEIAAWKAALGARKLAQPFPQLERTYTRAPDKALLALSDQTLPTRKMISELEKLGYRRGTPEDAGIVYEAHRTLAAAWVLSARHDGYSVSNGRNPSGPSTVLHGIDAKQRDSYEKRPREAMQSEALNDLRTVLGVV